MPIPLTGIALGVNAIGGLLKARSARRRAKRVRGQRLAALQPLKAELATGQYGLSQSEGAIQRQVTTQTLADLAERNILDSSVAAPQVAQAVAPIQLAHSDRNRSLAKYIAASEDAIASDTEAPGYGEYLGDTLGDVGGYLARIQGRRQARADRDEEFKRWIDLVNSVSPQGAQVSATLPTGSRSGDMVTGGGEEDYGDENFGFRFPKRIR